MTLWPLSLASPEMHLTGPQVQRLCGIEQSQCQAALDALVETKFLHVRPNGTYARLAEGVDVASPSPSGVDLGTRKSLPTAT